MKILVGITGSIAAYRSPDLVRRLLADGHEVEVVLTTSGERFVTRTTLETFLGKKILASDVFAADHTGTEHIARARWADVIFVYGATANRLASFAQGFADDFLNLQILAAECPIVLAPAMNPAMWRNPAVRDNVDRLRSRGFRLVGPIAGQVACGETGVGHIADLDEIAACLRMPELISDGRELAGKKILISSGPMQSAIDPARWIANRSSGQMGLELARDARRRGADVRVLLGPVENEVAKAFASFDCTPYADPASYAAALDAQFAWSDVFVSASAVLDFEVRGSDEKLSREALAKQGRLELGIAEVPDFVQRMCAQKRPDQRVVAFALEDGSDAEIIFKAQAKLGKKNCDWIVANPLREGRGPESSQNQVWICRKSGTPKAVGPFTKAKVAHEIWSEIHAAL